MGSGGETVAASVDLPPWTEREGALVEKPMVKRAERERVRHDVGPARPVPLDVRGFKADGLLVEAHGETAYSAPVRVGFENLFGEPDPASAVSSPTSTPTCGPGSGTSRSTSEAPSKPSSSRDRPRPRGSRNRQAAIRSQVIPKILGAEVPLKATGGRDFVAGDVHGCFATLEATLEELDYDLKSDQ